MSGALSLRIFPAALIITSTDQRRVEDCLRGYALLDAIFLPNDPWADTAKDVDLRGARLVTTEEVLSESLTGVAGFGYDDECHEA